MLRPCCHVMSGWHWESDINSLRMSVVCSGKWIAQGIKTYFISLPLLLRSCWRGSWPSSGIRSITLLDKLRFSYFNSSISLPNRSSCCLKRNQKINDNISMGGGARMEQRNIIINIPHVGTALLPNTKHSPVQRN